jgi:hypothetical protein
MTGYFYFLRAYGRPTDDPDKQGLVRCGCVSLSGYPTPEDRLEHYRNVNPGRKYCIVPLSCAIKVLGKDGLPDLWNDVDWPLPFPSGE